MADKPTLYRTPGGPMSTNPLTLPGDPTNRQYSGGGNGLADSWPSLPEPTNTSKTIQPDRFQPVQSITVPVVAGAAASLLIAEPPGKRVYFELLVSPDSVGSLAIQVNSNPLNSDTANWIVSPGVPLRFDQFVPQNRMFCLAIGGALRYTLTICNV